MLHLWKRLNSCFFELKLREDGDIRIEDEHELLLHVLICLSVKKEKKKKQPSSREEHGDVLYCYSKQVVFNC